VLVGGVPLAKTQLEKAADAKPPQNSSRMATAMGDAVTDLTIVTVAARH